MAVVAQRPELSYLKWNPKTALLELKSGLFLENERNNQSDSLVSPDETPDLE